MVLQIFLNLREALLLLEEVFKSRRTLEEPKRFGVPSGVSISPKRMVVEHLETFSKFNLNFKFKKFCKL